jgi:two-component system sensor histidine kinase TctE
MNRSIRRRLVLFLTIPLLLLRLASAVYDYYSGVADARMAERRPGEPASSSARTLPLTWRVDQTSLWRHLLWDFFELDVTLLLVWLGIHYGLRPLDELRREIDARAPDNLHPIDKPGAPSELVPLLRSLNRLLEMLNSAAQAQSRFVANAAHQLRTPIAGLAAQLDVLIADNRDQALHEHLQRLSTGLRQLTRTANQLLALSRAESGLGGVADNRTVDLKDLVAEVVERSITRAARANIELGVDARPAVVLADPSLLEEMLGNLIDNALNYTPAGGEVVVHCGQEAGGAYLLVDDTGPGIAPAERKRVLDRFYRIPGSRGSGTGLGLAIVHEIVRLYSATLSIESPPGGKGTRIRVQWPG